MHPFNGRFEPVDRAALEAFVAILARRIDRGRVDYVIGVPEGGSVPAYELGRQIDRPVILASRLPVELPHGITFEEPQGDILGFTRHLYGLRAGDRAVIVEDELTNGRSVVNAVRSLRRAGIQIDQVATLIAIDHPGLWDRMAAERIALHAALALPPELAPRPLDDAGE
jgi:adenine/guanine phosphoribosyltransferase-like PRPP-binding protein